MEEELRTELERMRKERDCYKMLYTQVSELYLERFGQSPPRVAN